MTSSLPRPQLGTLAYDSLKRRIVGFGAKQDASGKFVKTLVAAPVPPSKKYATLGEVRATLRTLPNIRFKTEKERRREKKRKKRKKEKAHRSIIHLP